MAQPAEFSWGRTFANTLANTLEQRQRQKQFNAELETNQQAAEALANYRLQSLAHQAEQLELTRRGQQKEYSMWKEGQIRDDERFKAGLVNGMTPLAATTKEELGQKKVMVALPDGQKVMLSASDAASLLTQLKVSENYSQRTTSAGASGSNKNWTMENENPEEWSDEMLDSQLAFYESQRRTEKTPLGVIEGAMPAQFADAYARAARVKAVRGLQRATATPPTEVAPQQTRVPVQRPTPRDPYDPRR